MRVLVCGGRNYSDSSTMTIVLVPLFLFGFKGETQLRDEAQMEDDVIIQGGARGADAMAKEFAKANDIKCEQYDADWKAYGKAAGHTRNQRMLDEGKPDVVIAFPGGTGTADMVRRARAAGVEVIEIAAQQPSQSPPSLLLEPPQD